MVNIGKLYICEVGHILRPAFHPYIIVNEWHERRMQLPRVLETN